MNIRTTKDIPDEIKNIVELFYVRDEELARSEAQKLRVSKPELAGIISNVLKLMPNAPENMFGFYDELIKISNSNDKDPVEDDFPLLIDDFMDNAFGSGNSSAEALDFDNLFDDDKDSDDLNHVFDKQMEESDNSFSFPNAKDFKETPQPVRPSGIHTPVRPITAVHEENKSSELRSFLKNDDLDDDDSFDDSFFKNLGKGKNTQTQLPSLFDNDQSNVEKKQNLGLRGRKLSNKPENKRSDFNLDIEVDFDSMGPSVNLRSILNASEPVEATQQRTGQFNAIANPIIAEKASGSKPSDPLATPVPNLSAGKTSLKDSARSNSPSIMRASQMSPNFSENSSSKRIANLVNSVSGNNSAKVNVAGIRPTSFDPDGSSKLRNITASQRIDSARKTVPKTNAVKDTPNDARSLGKDSIPRLACRMSELSKRTDINPKGGFLISLIDGSTSVGDIIELSMFSEEETLTLLNELVNQSVIDF